MAYPILPEDASYVINPTIIGSYELLPSRTNIHPITVEPGQQHKLSFLASANNQQLIIRMSFSEIPLEYPIQGWFKSLPPGGITVYLYDENTEFPPPPEMVIQNAKSMRSIISPFVIPVQPGEYFINMKNLANEKTSYTINLKL